MSVLPVPAEADNVVVKDMGLQERELVQALPALFVGYEWEQQGNVVLASQGESLVRLEFGPERRRRIAAIELPSLPVRLVFHGFSPEQRNSFLSHFNRRFQRGGG
ncbi:hypothetical protein [Aquisalimonas sp.]|uniref:hypothetical protein n=1 Tax=Aquisalimonas sp. TaxID=1872621 RepID=UPI0025B849DC|nr:hypothetical protein [Aquisalimonas sp.]